MFEYPKYRRDQKLSAKLSDNDVEEVRQLRREGWTLKQIALNFGVSIGCIWPITHSDEWLKRFYKERKTARRMTATEAMRYRKRKEIINPSVILYQKEWVKTHPENVKRAAVKCRKNDRDIQIKRKKWDRISRVRRREYINLHQRTVYIRRKIRRLISSAM